MGCGGGRRSSNRGGAREPSEEGVGETPWAEANRSCVAGKRMRGGAWKETAVGGEWRSEGQRPRRSGGRAKRGALGTARPLCVCVTALGWRWGIERLEGIRLGLETRVTGVARSQVGFPARG